MINILGGIVVAVAMKCDSDLGIVAVILTVTILIYISLSKGVALSQQCLINEARGIINHPPLIAEAEAAMERGLLPRALIERLLVRMLSAGWEPELKSPPKRMLR